MQVYGANKLFSPCFKKVFLKYNKKLPNNLLNMGASEIFEVFPGRLFDVGT